MAAQKNKKKKQKTGQVSVQKLSTSLLNQNERLKNEMNISSEMVRNSKNNMKMKEKNSSALIAYDLSMTMFGVNVPCGFSVLLDGL